MTTPGPGALAVLRDRWVEAAVYVGALSVLVAPLVWRVAGPDIGLVYLCASAYYLHQVEEHWGDRFRDFVNDRVFGGREVLTPGAVWWINVPGVWGIDLVAIYVAVLWGAGWALAVPYLLIVNGAAHAFGALRFGYNPGLATALLLFLPLGSAALAVIPATGPNHAVGAGITVLIHAVVVLHLARRAAA